MTPSVCPPLPRPLVAKYHGCLSPAYTSLSSDLRALPLLRFSFFFPLGPGWASQLALDCTGGGAAPEGVLLRHLLLSSRLTYFITHSQLKMSLSAVSQSSTRQRQALVAWGGGHLEAALDL